MPRKVIVLIALLLLGSVVRAQEPLILNQLKIGEITAASPNTPFSFSAAAGEALKIEVVEVTTGLAPQFTLTNATGALVKAVGNPTLTTTVSDTVTFAQAGAYVVTVSSVSGATGQFVIDITETAPAVPPTPLNVGQPVTGTLANGQSITFAVGSLPSAPLVLTVDGSVSISLQNSAGEIAASITSPLGGGAINLPSGAETYQLALLNDTDSPSVNYTVTLVPRETTPPPPMMTPEVGTTLEVTLPVLPTNGACVLATLRNEAVNVRTGPDTGFDRITSISPQNTYSVVGRTGDSSWYQIDYGGGQGWVAGYVTRRGGDCSNLPVTYTPPPQPTLQIAGDNEVPNAMIQYERGNEVGYYGNISYPQGDRQDTITYHLTGVPSNVPSDVQFRYHIDCTGSGYEYAEIVFSDGSTHSCTPQAYNVAVLFSDSSRRSNSITIRLTGGDNAYVDWNVIFSWYIP